VSDAALPLGGAGAGAPRPVRVYVDGRGVDVTEGQSAADAVRLADPAAARAVGAGERLITDSRGLPVDPAASVYAGAIFRLVAARGHAAAPDSPHLES